MKLKSEKTSKRWSALAVVPAAALVMMALAPSAQAAPRPGATPKPIVKVPAGLVPPPASLR